MSRILIKTEVPANGKSEIDQPALAKDFVITHLVFNAGAVPGMYLTGIWDNGNRILPSILGMSVLTLTKRIRDMKMKANHSYRLEFSNKSKQSVSLDLEIHGNLQR